MQFKSLGFKMVNIKKKKGKLNMKKKILTFTLALIFALTLIPAVSAYAGDFEIGNNFDVFVTADSEPIDRISGSWTHYHVFELGTTITVKTTLAPIMQQLEGPGGLSLRTFLVEQPNAPGDRTDWEMTLVDDYMLTYTLNTPGRRYEIWAVGGWTWGIQTAGMLAQEPPAIAPDTILEPITATDDRGIAVTIDGQPVIFSGQNPVIVDGRTLVPVRGVFEMLGFDVDWNPDTRRATLTRDADEIVIAIGSINFFTNGTSHSLDVPAQIVGGSTMLPIRAVLESVGYGLSWDEATNTVVIISESAGLEIAEGFIGQRVSRVEIVNPERTVLPGIVSPHNNVEFVVNFFDQQGDIIAWNFFDHFQDIMVTAYEDASYIENYFEIELTGGLEGDSARSYVDVGTYFIAWIYGFDEDSRTFQFIADATPRTIVITIRYMLDPSIYAVATIAVNN